LPIHARLLLVGFLCGGLCGSAMSPALAQTDICAHPPPSAGCAIGADGETPAQAGAQTQPQYTLPTLPGADEQSPPALSAPNPPPAPTPGTGGGTTGTPITGVDGGTSTLTPPAPQSSVTNAIYVNCNNGSGGECHQPRP
jgi:hypothetical protein